MARRLANSAWVSLGALLLSCRATPDDGALRAAGLRVEGPREVVVGACTGFTVTARNAGGAPAAVSTQTVVTLNVTGAGAGGVFHDPNCAQVSRDVVLPVGGISAAFYFRGSAEGEVILSAVAVDLEGGSREVRLVRDGDPSPGPSPPRSLVVQGPTALEVGRCSGPFAVLLRDAEGNPAFTNEPLAVGLSAAGSGAGVFYAEAGCQNAATSVQMLSGGAGAIFYFQGSAPGPLLLEASATVLQGASLSVEVVIPGLGRPSRLEIDGPMDLQAQTCTPYAVRALDPTGAPARVRVATAVTLALSGDGRADLFADPGCSQGGATTLIPSGESSATVSLRGTRVGDVTLTVAATGLTPAARTLSIAARAGALAYALQIAGPASLLVGACSPPLTVSVVDRAGDPILVEEDVSATLAIAGAGALFSDSACTAPAASAQIATGQSSARFHFRGTALGAVTLSAAASPLLPGTLTVILREPALAGVSTNGPVRAIATLADGTTFIGGDFTTIDPHPAPRVIRLLPDGEPDPVFLPGIGFDGAVDAAAVLPNGGIVVGGSFRSYQGQPAPGIARLDLSGRLDGTFTPSDQTVGFDGSVFAVAASADAIYVGGSFTSYRGQPARGIAKLRLDGTLDTTFNPPAPAANGIEAGGWVLALVVDGDALYAGGWFTEYRGQPAPYLLKLEAATGRLVPGFNVAGGVGPANQVTALLVAGDHLYVGGGFTEYAGVARTRLARVDKLTGVLDPSFDTSGAGPSTQPSALVLTPAERLVVVGGFSRFGTRTVNGIAEVLSTGEISGTFSLPAGAGVGFFNGVPRSVAVVGDALYVAGSFRSYRGDAANRVIKLGLDGTRDLTFSPIAADRADGLNGLAAVVAGAPSGIYLAGNFTAYRGRPVRYLAKFTASGEVDQAFNYGVDRGPAGPVHALLVQGDRLFVGGDFPFIESPGSSTTPVRVGNIAKLDHFGNVDTAFSAHGTVTVGADGAVLALAFRDGSLYLGGAFEKYGDLWSRHLAKVDAVTGVLDTTFNVQAGGGASSGVSDVVYALAAASQGVLVGGAFSWYRNRLAQHLVLVSGDGDILWNTNLGEVFSTVVAGDFAYVGGPFGAYGGPVARLLLADGSIDESFRPGDPLPPSAVEIAHALAVPGGGPIYAGGLLGTYRYGPATNLVRLAESDGALERTYGVGSAPLPFNDAVLSLKALGDFLFAGGEFLSYEGKPQLHFAVIRASTGALVGQ